MDPILSYKHALGLYLHRAAMNGAIIPNGGSHSNYHGAELSGSKLLVSSDCDIFIGMNSRGFFPQRNSPFTTFLRSNERMR